MENNSIIMWANVILVIVSIFMAVFAVFSFIKTLKENWKHNLRIAASEYLGELEKLRLRTIEHENDDSKNLPIMDPKLLGEIISLQKRLELLFGKRKKYKNILDVAEVLRKMADKGEFDKKYQEKEDSFIKMISSF
ncbi:MAG TPA: hypothetical protein VK469_03975 [Candidatus Kapabacteria bacterium]|nr:hypothetical protein [Candidatus Kapabacteria bacterium]